MPPWREAAPSSSGVLCPLVAVRRPISGLGGTPAAAVLGFRPIRGLEGTPDGGGCLPSKGLEKSWEEALDVASETEMLLIQKELNKYHTTKHVWIGLRFLSRDWIWVDGQEMDYEAWDEEGKPLCPQAKMKCAALQKTGGRLSSWRAHDCEKRLSFICY
uniref:C-type lectin domain-containing protein n=1 Tax=Neolamprologus brichardi TaxID=32507 RepID=A0A3Q4HSS8_NEOBR